MFDVKFLVPFLIKKKHSTIPDETLLIVEIYRIDNIWQVAFNSYSCRIQTA